MATLFPFVCLSRANQERVVARFFDACGHDGYLYELDVDGTVLCRCWPLVPFPALVRGGPSPWHGAFRKGYLAFTSGESRACCPYKDKRKADGRLTWSRAFRASWHDGWRYAQTVAHTYACDWHSSGHSYTGVGSRKTPAAVLDFMADIAAALARQRWILRSGGADGADTAFEDGALSAGGSTEIFLPWPGFNGHPSRLCSVDAQALSRAAEMHPVWERLSSGAQKMHGRNVYQVLGRGLDKPSRFLVCWTPDGAVSGEQCTRATGGTGMAIRIASAEKVPVLNLCRQETRKMLEDWVRADCKLPEPWL